MKSLNILDIQRKLHQRSDKTVACYEKVLEICHKQIMFNCDRKRHRFFFEVPEYMFGYPIFDVNDAIRFVVDALTKNGFLAIYYFPKFIYVSWDMEEIERHKNTVQTSNQLEHKHNRGTSKKNMKHAESVDIQFTPTGKLSLQFD